MEKFILVLFKDREEHDTFNIYNEELTEWEKKREKAKEDLNLLLNKHLPEECQPRCDHLITELEEIELNILEYKKKIYYEIGMKDGAKITETLKQE